MLGLGLQPDVGEVNAAVHQERMERLGLNVPITDDRSADNELAGHSLGSQRDRQIAPRILTY